jgi:hypothetical protein
MTHGHLLLNPHLFTIQDRLLIQWYFIYEVQKVTLIDIRISQNIVKKKAITFPSFAGCARIPVLNPTHIATKV